MKDHTQEILKFVFSKAGDWAGDDALAEWANSCATTYVALMAAIKDPKVRTRAIAERDDQMADCARRTGAFLDAVGEGDFDQYEFTIKPESN